jgi:hypothetical protein
MPLHAHLQQDLATDFTTDLSPLTPLHAGPADPSDELNSLLALWGFTRLLRVSYSATSSKMDVFVGVPVSPPTQHSPSIVLQPFVYSSPTSLKSQSCRLADRVTPEKTFRLGVVTQKSIELTGAIDDDVTSDAYNCADCAFVQVC